MRMADAMDLVDRAFAVQRGGEVVVPVIRAQSLDVLAASLVPAGQCVETRHEPLGPFEKQHEVLISPDELRQTRVLDGCLVIEPASTPWRSVPWPERGQPCPLPSYTSDTTARIPLEELRTWS
jgi:FlaA1/EpsC-like NDP-sugar epimerase